MRWVSMGTQTFRDPKVVRLGELHGPGGLAFWALLLMEAGAQERGGEVETTYRSLAFDLHIEGDEVKRILKSAVEVGLCHGVSHDVHGFKVTIPSWKKWQAAGRKSKERASRKALEQADVTGCRTDVASCRTVSLQRDKERDKEKKEEKERNPFDKNTIEAQV